MEPLNYLKPLAILFQASVAQQYVTDAMCECSVTCVPEKNKDPKSCDSYRPITVCSVLGKLLEKILYREISHKCDHGNQQFGFRESLGVQNAHAAFFLRFLNVISIRKRIFMFMLLTYLKTLIRFCIPKGFYLYEEMVWTLSFVHVCEHGIGKHQFACE